MISLYSIQALALVLLVVYVLTVPGRRQKGLPPGPPTLPIIGNLHQIPSHGTHFKLTEWAKKYGGIYSLQFGSLPAIVITDRYLVRSLIDKKSSIYSSRPNNYVSDHLITRGDHLLAMQYGQKWKQFRKLIHGTFREERVEREHVSLVEAEATQMARDFYMNPAGLMKHPARFSNSVAVSLITGCRTPEITTSHMVRIYTLLDGWSQIMEIGNTPPIDVFPFTKYIPQRFFNNWKTRAQAVRDAMDSLYGEMVAKVRNRRARIGSIGSLLDDILDQNDKLKLTENELNFLIGVLMEGGTDTSASTLLAFVQAMAAYPKVQAHAQAQIDELFPLHGKPSEMRSPAWSDYDRLPYMACLTKETLRWRTVAPLIWPRTADAADVVAETGHKIPRGATIVLNVWGMHMAPSDDPAVPPPEEYAPERYSEHRLPAYALATVQNPKERDHYAYGTGRRLCPGINLAEREIWVGVAKLLWMFEFTPKGEGINVDAKTAYRQGFLSAPLPFEVNIKVRSEARRLTLEKEWESTPEIFQKFKHPDDKVHDPISK